jgi:PAS domain S-box-containing protein
LTRIRKAIPSLAVVAVVVLTAGMVATIGLALIELHWPAFLAGVLLAAGIALASKASMTGSVSRDGVQAPLAAAHRAGHYVDDLMPAMIVYVDPGHRVRYHNRAYAEWLGKPAARLEGLELPGLVGEEAWLDIKARLDEAFAGSVVRYERVQAMHAGRACRVAALYLPHFVEEGRVAGVFCVLGTGGPARGTCRPSMRARSPAS